jgi:YrbI family 3-deoxy-D-manno-octulosonate 8-phosphate phosphatase
MDEPRPECLAVIPARGGSKGVPRKNVRDLAGKPLVAHTIQAALGAARITRVVVSTDDAEIAAAARRWGAGVVERPAEISGDKATSESAVLHALDSLREQGGYEPELVMLIQCTSPLTTAADLDGLVETLQNERADSAFAAAPFHHFLWRRGPDGAAQGINHEGKKRKRRQDLEPQFLENGAAYVMRTELFRQSHERFCGRTVPFVMDAERTLEIDDPLDFVKAEAVLRARATQTLSMLLPSPLGAVVFDFDGVLTDNRVFVFEDGREAVSCDRGDGLGLTMLRNAGVRMLILSKEQNPVVSARAKKLRIECLQGIDDKPRALSAWLAEHGLAPSSIVYVGNDVNDLECMRLAGCAVAPSDAHSEALRAATYVLALPGGKGAVRELCDAILAARPAAHAGP